MQLTEDHLLTTFASIRLRPASDERQGAGGRQRAPHIYIGKGPRIVNFAPWVNAKVRQLAAAARDSNQEDARAMMHGGFLAGADGDLFDSDEEADEDEDEEFVEADMEELIAQQHEDEDDDEWIEEDEEDEVGRQ